MASKGFDYIYCLETPIIKIGTFRCDNVGEIIKFKEKLVQMGLTINVEFLVPNTPQ